MAAAFPGTDIKGMPHINSKLTVWKCTYVSVAAALARSEVGFNEQTQTIDCNDETWSLVVKADKNIQNMRYKSFPLLPIWTEIFGKDRANGQRAEDVLDAFTNLLKEDLAAGMNMSDPECDVELDSEEGEDNSVCDDEPTHLSSKSGSNKRKYRDVDEDNQQIRSLIGSITSNTGKLDDISRFIGYEHRLGQKRESLFGILEMIEGLTDMERYDLAVILGKDSDSLEVFNGLPMEHKGPLLKRVMQ